MRAFLTSAVLTMTAFALQATPASAQTVDAADLIDSFYVRYLGRHVDSVGLSDHLRAIRAGVPIHAVEAAVLSSAEYYARNGNTPEGYVAALYRDVLGRRAGAHEFARHVDQVLFDGRNAVARRLLAERDRPVVVAFAPPVVLTPAPAVIVRPAPTVVVPSVVVPSYRYYPAPRSGISIRIGIR